MGWSQWIRTVEVEPAVDVGDPAYDAGQIELLLRAGCRIFHVNFGDDASGLRFLEHELAPLVRPFDGILDVHITGNPFALAGPISAAGGDSVTFEMKGVADVPAAIAEVRRHGLQVGVGFGEETDPDSVPPVAQEADVVLIRIRDQGTHSLIRRIKAALPATVAVQVEGGVDLENVRDLHGAGARLLVAKEAIFDREDLPRAFRRLVQLCA